MKDPIAKAAIAKRIDRAKAGNFGDTKPIGESVHEMRVDVAQDIRVYYVRTGKTVCVLLAGGTKRTQKRNIAMAQGLAAQL